jgi:acetate kinase
MRAGRILVVNAGSSSLKLRVLDEREDVVAPVDLPAENGYVEASSVELRLDDFGPFDAIGHRIVHGGTRFTDATVLDQEVIEGIAALAPLAPLHQPPALELVHLLRRLRPEVPAVASFDTAFHSTLPIAAATYAVPASWRDELGVRKFGFHGLSHVYSSRRAVELVGSTVAARRVVACHLGAGASLCAIDGGRSVETTMGFTPLDGLVMATRCCHVDPGLLLWLLQPGRLSVDSLDDALSHRSGLVGLAGTADMRTLLASAADGDAGATAALDVYVHRLVTSIGAMTAALGGLDVLVFTGGVGENAPELRRRVADRLAFLGVDVDRERNHVATPDTDVSVAGSPVHTLVVASREDGTIAGEVRAALGAPVRSTAPAG